MRPLHKAVLGMGLAVAGSLVALLYVGVYLMADCGPDCVARGERKVVLTLVAAGLVVALAGAVLARSGLRQRRRRAR